jgi:hypothetical protein
VSWLLVLLLGGAFVVAAVIVLRVRADAGVDLPEYSMFSEEPNGLAEVARKLRQMGWQPVPLTRLANPAVHRGLLILVEPPDHRSPFGTGETLSEADAGTLLRWVEAGNTLLLCSPRNSELSNALDAIVSSGDPMNDDTPHRLEPEEAGPYTEELESLEAEGRHTLSADRGLPLWWQDDRPAAMLFGWGAGRIILVADPSFLTRRRLHQGADNLVFLGILASLHARDGRVYFDEYHHGIRSSGGFWGYLQYHGQQIALVPVLLVVGIAIWAVAVRLGPAIATPRASRADAVDYASAVARIYQRAGARRLLARSLARGFLARLARHLNARRSALPAELLNAWRQRHPKDPPQRLEILLRGATELLKGETTDRQLLEWTRAFDQFEQEEKSSPAGSKTRLRA